MADPHRIENLAQLRERMGEPSPATAAKVEGKLDDFACDFIARSPFLVLSTADAEGFIVIFAEQEVRRGDQRWAWWTDWRWSSTSDDHPDLLFLEQLVEQFKSQYSVDTSRI